MAEQSSEYRNRQQQCLKIWELAREQVLSAFHFLVNATARLSFVSADAAGSMPLTDGRSVFYSEEELLISFSADPESPAGTLMHMLLHCLFGHPYRKQIADSELWDAACDIAVGKIIADLSADGGMGDAFRPADAHEEDIFFRVGSRAPHMTAEEIYNAVVSDASAREEILRWRELFMRDDHSLWTSRAKSGRKKVRGGVLVAVPDETDDEDTQQETGPGKGDEDELAAEMEQRDVEALKREWQKLARQAQMELTSFQNRFGHKAGRFVDQLQPILWQEIDYGEFLRNFGAEQEILHVSDEAFDIAYYKYGLEIYGNIPLIEPLEYAEEHRIRTFVIAIDTSGSVQGDIVQSFLQKTCDVLRSTTSFTRRVDILLMQCDAQVQSVTRIKDMDELEDVIKDLRLRGFGGTEFRPVFSYVRHLRDEGKMEKPDGLLYFTDGVGEYPAAAPDYKTAFIFNRDDHISPRVPSWAIRAVLSTDTIKLLGQ